MAGQLSLPVTSPRVSHVVLLRKAALSISSSLPSRPNQEYSTQRMLHYTQLQASITVTVGKLTLADELLEAFEVASSVFCFLSAVRTPVFKTRPPILRLATCHILPDKYSS